MSVNERDVAEWVVNLAHDSFLSANVLDRIKIGFDICTQNNLNHADFAKILFSLAPQHVFHIEEIAKQFPGAYKDISLALEKLKVLK